MLNPAVHMDISMLPTYASWHLHRILIIILESMSCGILFNFLFKMGVLICTSGNGKNDYYKKIFTKKVITKTKA
jgi:hypothetical protein